MVTNSTFDRFIRILRPETVQIEESIGRVYFIFVGALLALGYVAIVLTEQDAVSRPLWMFFVSGVAISIAAVFKLLWLCQILVLLLVVSEVSFLVSSHDIPVVLAETFALLVVFTLSCSEKWHFPLPVIGVAALGVYRVMFHEYVVLGEGEHMSSSETLPWIVITLTALCVAFVRYTFHYFASITENALKDQQMLVHSYRVIHKLGQHLTENRKRESQHYNLLQTDSLTQTLSRHAFTEFINHGYSRLPDGQHCVTYLDLDGLKEVNDKQGHNTGDKYLVEAATVLKSMLRTDDRIFRIGGDEFVTVLVNCTEEVATNLVSKIQDEFNESNGYLGPGFSVGIKPFMKSSDTDFSTVISQADFEMYQNKKTRKNSRSS